MAAAGRGGGDAGVLGLGVRGDPAPRRGLLPRGPLAGAAAGRRALPRGGRAQPRPASSDGARVGLDRRDRGAVVRHLQRRAQRGRAARRRRHGGDADPGLAGADRVAGGGLPARAVHALPRRRTGPGVRRRRPDQPGHVGERRQRRARRPALPAVGGGLLHLADPPEAPRRPALRAARDVAGLHGGRRGVPPVRRTARDRGGRRADVVRALGDLPRRLPDGDRLHDLRVRAAAHERQHARHLDLPRAADHDRAGSACCSPRRPPPWRTPVGRSPSSGWPWRGASHVPAPRCRPRPPERLRH